jgi:hypothetical protein
MDARTRPTVVKSFALLLAIAGMATGYFGLSANGYLVPAACLFAMAALAWLGTARALFRGVLIVNLAAGALLVLVLAFGAPLGDRKLDISGVALLANLLTGGPLLGLLAPPLILGLREGRSLARWFAPGSRDATRKGDVR